MSTKLAITVIKSSASFEQGCWVQTRKSCHRHRQRLAAILFWKQIQTQISSACRYEQQGRFTVDRNSSADVHTATRIFDRLKKIDRIFNINQTALYFRSANKELTNQAEFYLCSGFTTIILPHAKLKKTKLILLLKFAYWSRAKKKIDCIIIKLKFWAGKLAKSANYPGSHFQKLEWKLCSYKLRIMPTIFSHHPQQSSPLPLFFSKWNSGQVENTCTFWPPSQFLLAEVFCLVVRDPWGVYFLIRD